MHQQLELKTPVATSFMKEPLLSSSLMNGIMDIIIGIFRLIHISDSSIFQRETSKMLVPKLVMSARMESSKFCAGYFLLFRFNNYSSIHILVLFFLFIDIN